MSPHERRQLELEHQDLRWRVYTLEGQLNSCNEAVARIRGRLRSFERSLDLGYAQRNRATVSAQLAEARARADTVARQLAPAPGQFDDIRENEVAALATFAMMEKLVGR